jgi:DNA-binding NarL/FixJ family response regulator
MSLIGESRLSPQAELDLRPVRNAAVLILVAVEYPIVYEGIASLLRSHVDLNLVAWTSADGNSLPALDLRPDIIVVDMNPAISILRIAEQFPDAKLVALTVLRNEEQVHQAFQMGARGYLLKTSALQHIVECLQVIARGQHWIPPEIAEILSQQSAFRTLTPREADVLRAMAQGKNNREIGEGLKMCEGTVKVHVGHILGKLRAKSRTEALVAAAARGLVSVAKASSKPGTKALAVWWAVQDSNLRSPTCKECKNGRSIAYWQDTMRFASPTGGASMCPPHHEKEGFARGACKLKPFGTFCQNCGAIVELAT